jgi:hypothetical protein
VETEEVGDELCVAEDALFLCFRAASSSKAFFRASNSCKQSVNSLVRW